MNILALRNNRVGNSTAAVDVVTGTPERQKEKKIINTVTRPRERGYYYLLQFFSPVLAYDIKKTVFPSRGNDVRTVVRFEILKSIRKIVRFSIATVSTFSGDKTKNRSRFPVFRLLEFFFSFFSYNFYTITSVINNKPSA